MPAIYTYRKQAKQLIRWHRERDHSMALRLRRLRHWPRRRDRRCCFWPDVGLVLLADWPVAERQHRSRQLPTCGLRPAHFGNGRLVAASSRSRGSGVGRTCRSAGNRTRPHGRVTGELCPRADPGSGLSDGSCSQRLMCYTLWHYNSWHIESA